MFSQHHAFWRTSIRPVVMILIAAALFLLPSTANAAPLCSIWTVVRSPNVTTGQFADNTLLSVAAISDTNVWAVGSESNTGASPRGDHPLIEHWNGSAWSISQFGSQVVSQIAFLTSVSASAANDVWAVGSILPNGDFNTQLPLSEHWNGSAWSVVTMPVPTGAITTRIEGVAAIAANNAWAVGTFSNNSLNLPLIEHWNGSAWSVTPNVPREVSDSNDLHGITAISANDIWAVGEFDEGGPINLEMHWNGTSWSLATPAMLNVGAGESGGVPVAASGIAQNDVWAVGGVEVTDQNHVQTQNPFAIHWNGTQWTEVATPPAAVPSAANAFTAVSALTTNDVWAVGINSGGGFIEHWNGTSWSMAPTPALGVSGSALFGIAKSGATSLWAVGSTNPSALVTNTLTIHTTLG